MADWIALQRFDTRPMATTSNIASLQMNNPRSRPDIIPVQSATAEIWLVETRRSFGLTRLSLVSGASC